MLLVLIIRRLIDEIDERNQLRVGNRRIAARPVVEDGERHSQADGDLRAKLSVAWLQRLVALIPETWLDNGREPTHDAGPAEQRRGYLEYLSARLDAAPIFVAEALHARTQLL